MFFFFCTLVLICISLMISDAEHFSIWEPVGIPESRDSKEIFQRAWIPLSHPATSAERGGDKDSLPPEVLPFTSGQPCMLEGG